MEFELYDRSESKTLLELIRKRSCVLFVGSGLSTGMYPSWEALIRELCSRCGVRGISGNDDIDPKLLLAKADEAQFKDPMKYHCTLRDIFASVVVHRREAYELLMRLSFKFYVTTNFDPLLAYETKKPEHRCPDIYRYPDLPHRHGRAAYYIHGMVTDESQSAQTIILSKADFDIGYSPEKTLYSFLHQVLTYEPILFIGCQLREPELKEMFRICRETRKEIELFHGKTAPKRYIFLPYKFLASEESIEVKRDEQIEEQENSEFSELGITVVRYNPKDENHSGLEEILTEWCQLPPLNIRKGFDLGDS